MGADREDVRREFYASRPADGDDAGKLRHVKFKLHDKRAALVDIGRHLGMFNDKLTLKGDAENPLTLVIKQLQGKSIQPVAIVPPQEELEFRGRH